MKFIAIAILGSILVACNTQVNTKYSGVDPASEDLALNQAQEHPGKKLMENKCYVCHNPKRSEKRMKAPPMIAIKMHYISDGTSKEEFANSLVDWTKKPSNEKSKMPGAVKKFGLMPYQFYSEKTIREIADYMFSNQIEQPDWFQEQHDKMKGKNPNIQDIKG